MADKLSNELSSLCQSGVSSPRRHENVSLSSPRRHENVSPHEKQTQKQVKVENAMEWEGGLEKNIDMVSPSKDATSPPSSSRSPPQEEHPDHSAWSAPQPDPDQQDEVDLAPLSVIPLLHGGDESGDDSDEARAAAYRTKAPLKMSKLHRKLLKDQEKAKSALKRREGASFAVLYNAKKQPEWGEDVRAAMEARGLSEVTPMEADVVWGRYTLDPKIARPSTHMNRYPGGWGALTTKRGLTKSLTSYWRATSKRLPLDEFWPRCYSLGTMDSRAEFEKDFKLADALTIMRKSLLTVDNNNGEAMPSAAEVFAACGLWGMRLNEPWNTRVASAGLAGLPKEKMKALVRVSAAKMRQSSLSGP